MKDDIITLANLLNELDYKLVSAESITAGLFGARICEVNGASKFYEGGVIVYSPQMKIDLLKVDENIINTYGVVSPECVEAMTSNVQALFNADVAVAFSGNAGPTSLENKPVGLVYIGIKIKDEQVKIYELHLKGARNVIRKQCVEAGINYLIHLLQ
ncbi:MAG: CinA family protein [Erysipelotrichaceae bacterium]|nr:CinA family protein [Erysipelotrichaceae bacterium]